MSSKPFRCMLCESSVNKAVRTCGRNRGFPPRRELGPGDLSQSRAWKHPAASPRRAGPREQPGPCSPLQAPARGQAGSFGPHHSGSLASGWFVFPGQRRVLWRNKMHNKEKGEGSVCTGSHFIQRGGGLAFLARIGNYYTRIDSLGWLLL